MTFYIQSVHSGLYLDIEGGDEDAGATVILYDFHGDKNQQWKYINSQIISKLNGLVLDIDDSNDDIIMRESCDSKQQKWHFNDDFTIQNGNGKALDVENGCKDAGTPLIVFEKHGESNQKFRVVPVNKNK